MPSHATQPRCIRWPSSLTKRWSSLQRQHRLGADASTFSSAISARQAKYCEMLQKMNTVCAGIARSACVLVACWVRCTRAHRADGCSCNSTAGGADIVCEPVERLRVLAVLGPGIAHSAWCASRTSSQDLVAQGAIGFCLHVPPCGHVSQRLTSRARRVSASGAGALVCARVHRSVSQGAGARARVYAGRVSARVQVPQPTAGQECTRRRVP